MQCPFDTVQVKIREVSPPEGIRVTMEESVRLFVRPPSHGWINQKQLKLGLCNMHSQLNWDWSSAKIPSSDILRPFILILRF